MAKMPTPDRDPGGLFGALGALASAVIALLVAFGVELTPDQTAAILGVLAAAAPIVTAFAIRAKVWSPARHYLELEQAFDRGRNVGANIDPPNEESPR